MRIQKLRTYLFVVAAVVAGRASAAPLVQYSQDGKTYAPFSVMVGREKVREYYDYRDAKGHPGFGTEEDTTTAAVYYDEKRNALSLVVISGGGETGKVRYGFKRLPGSTYLTLSDDPDEFSYKKGTTETDALFRYNNGNDGVVFSGLEDTGLGIKVAVKAYKDMSAFRLVDGAGGFIELDLDKPLYLADVSVTGVKGRRGRAPQTTTPPPVVVTPPTDGVSQGPGGGVTAPPPVPEPGAALLAVGAAGLLAGRRRRR